MEKYNFRLRLSLFFIAVCAVFFLAFKVVYGQLTLSKEDAQTEFDRIYSEQVLMNYQQIAPYTKDQYTYEVHSYLSPPYTEQDKGYLLIQKSTNTVEYLASGKLSEQLSKSITLPEVSATSTK